MLEHITAWLLKIYKASPRIVIPICILSGLVLYLPLPILRAMKLEKFAALSSEWLGPVFWVTLLFTLSYPVEHGATWIYGTAMSWVYSKRIKDRLHRLSLDEQQALAPYISRNQRTLGFRYQNGTVGNLRICRILYIPNPRIDLRSPIPHTMYEWVWDYLKKHPELIGLPKISK